MVQHLYPSGVIYDNNPSGSVSSVAILTGNSDLFYPFSVRKKQLLAAKGRPSTWVAL